MPPNIQRPHIYLDYETNIAGNCYLLGYKIEGKFTQIITDKRLEGLAEFRNFEVKTAEQATIDLLTYAKDSDSIIVAYSEAERDYFKRFSTGFDTNEFADIPYLNLRKAAKRWINSYRAIQFNALPPFLQRANPYQARQLKRALCSVMRLTSFHAPKDYAPGRTTSRLNTVADALVMRNQDYSSLTPTQKAKATKALKHNRFDVEALPVLFNAIYADDVQCFSNSFKNCFDDD